MVASHTGLPSTEGFPETGSKRTDDNSEKSWKTKVLLTFFINY